MSKFFKALQQAERDRALLEQAERQDGDQVSPESEAPSPLTPHPSPLASLEPPRSQPSSPVQPRGLDQHLVSLLDPTCFEAEQYRTVRHIIEQVHLTSDVSVVGVSSSASGDGKTITAINLAGTLAQAANARVLLMETDLRRPALVRYLGLSQGQGRGLVDAILHPDLPLDEVVTTLPQFRLTALPGGCPQPASYELLKSPRFEALLGEARKQYDYIILDTPPLIPLSDCRLILKLADTLLLVVAAHQTPRKLLEEALNVIDPAKVLGIIFNNDDRPLAGYYYRYHEYHKKPGQKTRPYRMGKRLIRLLWRVRASGRAENGTDRKAVD